MELGQVSQAPQTQLSSPPKRLKLDQLPTAKLEVWHLGQLSETNVFCVNTLYL